MDGARYPRLPAPTASMLWSSRPQQVPLEEHAVNAVVLSGVQASVNRIWVHKLLGNLAGSGQRLQHLG